MQTIYRLETGRQRLTLEWLNRLSDALNTPASELMDDNQPWKEPVSEPGIRRPVTDDASTADLGAVVPALLPGIKTVDVFTISGDALKPCGILDGDHLMIERGARPERGEIVVIELLGSRRQAERIARVYDPPYLISYSLHADERRPILVDDAHVKIIGVVRGVIRL
jgi:hypothetical protein